eukprot:305608-Chlamydomonas_euryale.AAC.1
MWPGMGDPHLTTDQSRTLNPTALLWPPITQMSRFSTGGGGGGAGGFGGANGRAGGAGGNRGGGLGDR